MAVIDVYKQYFEADAIVNTVQRNGVVATLTAASEGGTVKYEVGLSFFPHNDPEDFAVSYDAFVAKEIYNAKGRRSKKREKVWLEEYRTLADALAGEYQAKIFWDKPLNEAELG